MSFLPPLDISVISPCASDPDRIRARVDLMVDMTGLLPYLNAALPGAIYDHQRPSLTLTREFRLITVYSNYVMVDRALNTTDAYQVMDWLRDTINDVHARRSEIKPIHVRRPRPSPVAIYRLLPGTNCGDCGSTTCLAFAAGLSAGGFPASDCPFLDEATRSQLSDLLSPRA